MAVRREEVQVTASVGDFVSKFAVAGKAARGFADDLDHADSHLSGLAAGVIALGPTLVPLAAAAVPAIAGLTTQLGFAAVGAGTAVLAFQGLGTALKALNDYSLDPSAENLDAARAALDQLAPAAQEFALRIDQVRPRLERLQAAAANGLFPGAEDGLNELLTRLPEVQDIISTVASTMGELLREGGKSLAGPEWTGFFTYIEQTAQPVMLQMGRTLGNFIHGLAELWMAVDPLSRGFSSAFLSMSRDFDRWASGLSGSQGLQSFIDYLHTAGPRAWEALQALAGALLSVAEAAAPVGNATLPIITAVAHVLSTIADSPAGPVLIATAAGVATLAKAFALMDVGKAFAMSNVMSGWRGTAATMKSSLPTMKEFGTWVEFLGQSTANASKKTLAARESMDRFSRSLAPAIGTATLAGVAFSGLGDKMGLSNTVMLALAGSMAGPWGAAAGGFVGLLMDAAATNDDFAKSVTHVHDVMQHTPLDFRAQQAAIDSARQSAEAYKAKVSDLSGSPLDALISSFQPNHINLSSLKNDVEDIFGASEVQDQAKQLQGAVDEVQNYRVAWSGLINALKNQGDPFGPTTDYTKNLQQLGKYAASIQPALDALDLNVTDLGPSSYNYEKNVEAIQAWLRVQDSIPGRTRAVGAAIGGLGDDLLSTSSSADALSTALDRLLSPQLNAEQATDQLHQSLKAMRTELEKGAKTFQGYTKNAEANRAATRTAVTDTIAQLTAMAKAGDSPRQLAQALGQSRQAFIAEGEAAGFSHQQMVARARAIGLTPKLVRTVFQAAGIDVVAARARDIVDQLHKMPKQVQIELKNNGYDLTKAQIDDLAKRYHLTPKQVQTILRAQDNASAVIDEVDRRAVALDKRTPNVTITTNAGSVIGQILNVQRTVNDLHGNTITITTHYVRTGKGGSSVYNDSAAGNLFDMAGRHTPKIGDQNPQLRPYNGPQGLTWSEEGSGPWEAFISGNPKHAARSRSILELTAARLGGEVAWRAAKGLMLERATMAQPSVQMLAGGAGVTFPSEFSLVAAKINIPGLGTGTLEGTMRVIARQEIDDNDTFHETRNGRRR